MLKLAMYEGIMDIRQYIRENKGLVGIGIFIVLCVFLSYSVDGENFNCGYWTMYLLILLLGCSQYGKNKIFPAIFSYVPIGMKEKKQYILYRTFGGVVMLFFGFLFIGVILVLLGMISIHYLALWLCVWLMIAMVKQREIFYGVYKNISGRVYYSDMQRLQMVAFWVFRVMDFVAAFVGLGFVFVNDNRKLADFGVKAFLVMGIVVLYQVISLLHHIYYLKQSFVRLELPDMI